MTNTGPARLGVFLSGSGRTLENLLDEIDAGRLPARIALVLASRPCRGADIARDRGIATQVRKGDIPAPDLDALATRHRLDWIVLAGYMRLVSIPGRLRGRVVNIHPALLPDFGGTGLYGHRVHEAVLQAARDGRITETGCTVHLADDTYDTGPIVLQKRCPVHADDTVDTLAARVFDLEKQAYPEALRILLARQTE